MTYPRGDQRRRQGQVGQGGEASSSSRKRQRDNKGLYGESNVVVDEAKAVANNPQTAKRGGARSQGGRGLKVCVEENVFKCVNLPEHGSQMDLSRHGDTINATVLSPVGRNGKPLRSLLFSLGFMFEPSFRLGHNFYCCVPVKDKSTGMYNPCNTALKIPKGSLGNPFRHMKYKHPLVYKQILERKEEDKKMKHAAVESAKKLKTEKMGKNKNPKTKQQQQQHVTTLDHSAAAVAAAESGGVMESNKTMRQVRMNLGALTAEDLLEGERRRHPPADSDKSLGILSVKERQQQDLKETLRKAVVFCCFELLPLDEIFKDAFRFIFPLPKDAFQDFKEEKNIQSLYKMLKVERNSLCEDLRQKLMKAQSFYEQTTQCFVHIKIDTEVVKMKGPLVSFYFVGERGEAHVCNLVDESNKQLLSMNCCNEDFGIHVDKIMNIVLPIAKKYGLQIDMTSTLSIQVNDYEKKHINSLFFEGEKEGIELEDMAVLEEFLDPNNTSLLEHWQLDKFAQSISEIPELRASCKEELENFQGLKGKKRGKGIGTRHLQEYPILYKLACALGFGFGKKGLLQAQQTSREQKLIAENLFLCDDIYKLVKPTDIAYFIDSTLFIKYNAITSSSLRM